MAVNCLLTSLVTPAPRGATVIPKRRKSNCASKIANWFNDTEMDFWVSCDNIKCRNERNAEIICLGPVLYLSWQTFHELTRSNITIVSRSRLSTISQFVSKLFNCTAGLPRRHGGVLREVVFPPSAAETKIPFPLVIHVVMWRVLSYN